MTKFSKWFKELILPAGLLSSLIIGAGMFALPYVFSEAGFLVGLFYLGAFTFAVTRIHLMYSTLLSSTAEDHRFVGLSKIYLGNWGFWTSLFTTVVGIVLILLIYLVLSSSFIKIALPGIDPLVGVLIFWLTAALANILSVKRLAGFEFLVTLAMALIVLVVFVYGLPKFEKAALTDINLGEAFLPYGAILFALYGRAGISSLRSYFRSNQLPESKISRVIILGTSFPALVYLLFVLGIVGLSGTVSADAVSGIVSAPPGLREMIGWLGIFSLWTSYVFLGLELRGILSSDFKLPALAVPLLVALSPIALYFAGLGNFIKLVGISGGVFLALESIMVILMYGKIKTFGWFSRLLIAVFLLGGLYEILQLI
ncbi:MAG: hypothetical protein HYW37_02030 [Candidatus Colwellbacteria bacterium]|nr:hypothetical protein [Candidatus Colwellbacteria bacterium]